VGLFGRYYVVSNQIAVILSSQLFKERCVARKMTRLLLWGGIGLLAVLAVAMAIPASRYRLLGLLGIERLYNGRPIEYWIAALKDPDPEVRRTAAVQLGNAEAHQDAAEEEEEEEEWEEAVAALVEAMADSDGFVRKCAATSLLIFSKDVKMPKDERRIACLTGALKDPEVAVRRAAVRGLWQAGPAAKQGDGVARLTDALGDKDDYVRAYGARALARIGPDAKDAMPALLKHLRTDPDKDIRKLSAKAIGLIGPDALGLLRGDVITALTEATKDESRGLREYSVRALGELRAKEAIPALRQASDDQDNDVRAAAVQALKSLEAAP
jgi:HEAT repeat protein